MSRQDTLGGDKISRREALRFGGLAAAGIVGGTVAAKSNSSFSMAGTRVADTRLTTVTDQLGWLKTSQFAGYYAAINNGYFRQQGIEDNLIAGGPNITTSSVVGSGHALVGCDDNDTALIAISKGEPNVIFATLYQRSPNSIFSYAKNPVRTLADFAHKTIAASAAEQALVVPLLERAHVDVSTIHFVPTNSVAQFANHEVDAYWGYSTNEGMILRLDGIKFITVSLWNLGLKSMGNVVITQRHTLATQKSLLVRYLHALIQGWEYAIAHPVAMGELTVKKFAPPGDNLKSEILQAQAQVSLVRNPAGIMRFTYGQMQATIDSAITSKVITKRLKATDVSTTEIMDAVYGRRHSLPL